MSDGCPSCSAPLPSRGVVCRYCGGRLDLDLQGWRHLRSSSEGATLQCPDGHGPLEWLELPAPASARGAGRTTDAEACLRLARCPSCLGLFLPLGSLERLLDQAVGPVWSVDPQLLQALVEQPRAEGGPWRYRPCPCCGELMHRQLHGQRSGVVVDRCRDHGLWLDAGELRQLLEWTRAGGALLDQRRRQEQAEAEAAAIAREQMRAQTAANWAEEGDSSWSGQDPEGPDLLTLLQRLVRLLG
jgi:Zn-finger nucleic acid-binding protein